MSVAGSRPTRGPPAIRKRRREGCGLLNSMKQKTHKDPPSRSCVFEDRMTRVRFARRVCCPIVRRIDTLDGTHSRRHSRH